ncbi:unnamed protein product [Mytilus coruscus]|uniref:B box-type domain-containing protein n=1 Tax=Mytilus coruscus TaxID=42192 RepID=A0A6J8ANZ8_MYTCO|nr:unnamed protein product [Mytilus coruscus]
MAFGSSIQKGQIPVGCALCDGGHTIQWKCFDCNLLMCERCRDGVHLKIAKDHRIRNIKDIDEHERYPEAITFSDNKCEEHKGNACCLFCKTCKKLICPICIAKVHNGHQLIEDGEHNDKRETLKARQKYAENIQRDLVNAKERLRQIKTDENTKYTKTRKEIIDHRIEVQCAFDKLVEEIDRNWKEINKNIEQEQVRVEKIHKKADVEKNAFEVLIGSRDFAKFFDEVDQLKVSVEPIALSVNYKHDKFGNVPKYIHGKIDASLIGTLENRPIIAQQNKIVFRVLKYFTTDLKCLHNMFAFPDGSLWMYDNSKQILQNVKLEENSCKVISSIPSVKINGMAFTTSNSLLVSTRGTQLKLINIRTGQITDSKYDLKSMFPSSIKVTVDQKIILGAVTAGKLFPVAGRRVVIVIDKEGNHLKEYEYDNKNKRLFAYPKQVTITNDGNIFVIDKLDDTSRGRVVVLEPDGNVIQVYAGHGNTNSEEPFIPAYILATPNDNIIISEDTTCTLHILDNKGQIILLYNLRNIGIKLPYSIAMSTRGTIYVGCSTALECPETEKAKLYELEYFGI